MADRILVEIKGDASDLVRASTEAKGAIAGVSRETKSQTTTVVGEQGKQRKSTGLMSSSLITSAKSWAKFGAASAAALGAGAAIRKITGDTMDFDAAMRNVNSIAQLSEKQLGKLEDRVLSLAGPTAQAPLTLAQGMYDLVSSGFKANDALKIVGVSAKAATAGLTDTATASKVVAAVLNSYRLPVSDAAHVSDLLFQTVNRGVVTFSELSTSIGDVLPFAAQLNIGLDQVGAAIATMTKEGFSGADAATRLKQAMVAFIKPSTDLKETLHSLGFESGAQIIQQKGFQGALNAVTKEVGGTQAAVAKLFPDVRGLAGTLALTGKNAGMASEDLRAMADAGGATDRALEQQSQSITYQWNKLKAEASALAIRVGFAFIKVVKDIAHARGAVGKTVHDIATFLGPILARIIGGVKAMFSGMLKSIASAMKLIGDLLHGRWSKIWGDVKGIFEGFFRWLGGVGKLMSAPLVAGARLVDRALTSAFGGMWTGIKGVFTDGANAVIDVMNTLLDILDAVPFVDVGQIGHLGGVGGTTKRTRSEKGQRVPQKAGGGMIGGSGLRDTVPILAAPGEAILNRHQQAPVETALRATYGIGLGELFRREQRPHYMARGGFADLPRFSVGSFVGDAISSVGGAAKDVLRNVAGAGAGGAKWLASQLPTVPAPFSRFPSWAAGLAADWLTGETKKFGKLHSGPAPGVGGYRGPPADMKRLGDPRYVDSHTLAVTAIGDRMFGLTMSSGYRSPAHNAAIGGAPGSLHTHGSPTNPGATDSVGSMGAMQSYVAWMKAHVAGLEEAMVDNYAGSGYNAHIGFFNRGGFVGRALRRFAKGGKVGNINHVYPESSGFPGGGYTLPGYVIARLAEHFGMPGRTMEQITRGESAGQPGAIGHDPGGTRGLGLWMITTGYNDGLIRRLGGETQMRNPVKNAKAAKSIWDSQGIGAWYGTRFVTGNNLHYSGKFTDADLQKAMGRGRAEPAKPETGLGKGVELTPDIDGALGGLHSPWVSPNVIADFGRFLPRSIHLPASVKGLPKWLQAQLRTRGLNYGQVAAIAADAISAAQNTPGGTDDKAARTFQIDTEKIRLRQVARALRAIKRSLHSKGIGAKAAKKLRGQQAGLMALYRSLRIDIGAGLGDIGTTDADGLTKELLASQLLAARQDASLSAAQYNVFAGMLSGLSGAPFVGAFERGGLVRNTGIALVHEGERIQPAPVGPYGRSSAPVSAGQAEPPTVNLVLQGDAGNLVKLIDARVDGRAAHVTNRQLGRQGRRLAVAPGRIG